MSEEEGKFEDDEQLQNIFVAFCKFGDKNASGRAMDGFTYKKVATDCKLMSKTCTKTDIDLIFTKNKPKGGRTLDYDRCVDAEIPLFFSQVSLL